MSDIDQRIERLRQRAHYHAREYSEHDVLALCDELERLQGIVARLPVTADGVPVVPGMEIYVVESSGRVWQTLALHFSEGSHDDPVCVRTVVGWETVRCCYSTREAAEAAKEES